MPLDESDLQGPRLGAERRTEHPGVEREPRWRFLISPQFVSLLLVVAIGLLTYVTVQTKAAAQGARTQSILNQTIIRQQSVSDAQARERAVEAIRANQALAADAVRQLLAAQANDADRSDSELADLEARLLAAIADLEALIRRYDREERQRDRQRTPTPTPGPSPTCLPIVRVCAG